MSNARPRSMMQGVSPRNSFRDPISEIGEAATLLNSAVSAHLVGNPELAAELVRQANMPAIREWTESLWGARSPYAPRPRAMRSRVPASQQPRHSRRMPSLDVMLELHKRDGFHCRFCGIPIIRAAIRQRFCKLYPALAIWGRRNTEQHAAFQAMWAQYDHIVPHAHGGGNDLENLVVTCAPCNYARMEFTLEESNLIDPRTRTPVRSSWDGLERFR